MWLMEPNAWARLQRAERMVTPTATDIQAFEATVAAALDQRYVVADGTAVIPIVGVLTNKPSYMARYYGGGNTTYPSLIESIALAEADPTVNAIEFQVDSPGGTIAGLFDFLAAMQAITKPTRSVVGNMAASAAYAAVAQTDTIIASNPATQFGSVGVVVTYTVWPEDVDITSTNAPNKRPDITTEEGKAIVRYELDALENLFIESIATGRATDRETVIKDYGQGSVFVAAEAIKRGMADEIATTQAAANSPQATAKNIPGGKSMDLNQLKAEHKDVYEAAVKIGFDDGKSAESDRVAAHRQMGKTYGAMDVADEAIASGEGLTDKWTAKYLCAGKSAEDIAALEEDAKVIPETPKGEHAEMDEGDKVYEAMYGNKDDEGVLIDE